MTRGSVAASVRENKEKHPERYCANSRCLWSLRGGKPCPKHPVAAPRNADHTTTPWEVVATCGEAYRVYSRMFDGELIYITCPVGTLPGPGGGGYRSIETAVRVKGLVLDLVAHVSKAESPERAAELEYQREIQTQPRYHDGAARPQWSALSAIARWQRVRIASGEVLCD